MTDPDDADRLVVRATSVEDADDYRALRLEALADSPAAFGTTLAEARAYDPARWASLAASGATVLAWRAGRPVGMATGGLNDAHPGTRWLYGMYVTASERGRGVAEALVEAVLERTRALGDAALFLQVTGAMGRARAFYARLGFEPTGERRAMRRDPSLTLSTLARPLDREPIRVRRVAADALVELRTRVLRDGDASRAARNPLDDEPSTWHFGAFLGEDVVGSASFYSNAGPRGSSGAYQLRYMAVEPGLQGRGVGRILLEHAEAILAANAVRHLWAHARDSALGFYRATGWEAVAGSEHLSVETGLPHTTVTKALTGAGGEAG
ncbi:MAG: GNAT family N-acetyltransferase [Acidimicrobiales bacterium]